MTNRVAEDLKIEVGPNAKQRLIMTVEGRVLTDDLSWRGDKWLAEFDRFVLDPGSAELEVVVLVAGRAAKCKFRVRIKGKKWKTLNRSFKNGFALLNERLNLDSDFEDDPANA